MGFRSDIADFCNYFVVGKLVDQVALDISWENWLHITLSYSSAHQIRLPLRNISKLVLIFPARIIYLKGCFSAPEDCFVEVTFRDEWYLWQILGHAVTINRWSLWKIIDSRRRVQFRRSLQFRLSANQSLLVAKSVDTNLVTICINLEVQLIVLSLICQWLWVEEFFVITLSQILLILWRCKVFMIAELYFWGDFSISIRLKVKKCFEIGLLFYWELFDLIRFFLLLLFCSLWILFVGIRVRSNIRTIDLLLSGSQVRGLTAREQWASNSRIYWLFKHVSYINQLLVVPLVIKLHLRFLLEAFRRVGLFMRP